MSVAPNLPRHNQVDALISTAALQGHKDRGARSRVDRFDICLLLLQQRP